MPVKIANAFAPQSEVGVALNNAITSYANNIPTYGEVQEGRVNANKADMPERLRQAVMSRFAGTEDGGVFTAQQRQNNQADLVSSLAMGGALGDYGNVERALTYAAANPESIGMRDSASMGSGVNYNATETGFNKDQSNDILKTKMQQDGANYRAQVQARASAKTAAQTLKEEEKTKGRAAFQSILDEMGSAYGDLDANDGLVDNEGNIFKNVVARLGGSAAGQLTGGFVGTKNQTQRDIIASRLPLLKQAVMSATGMSSKQMDSNVEMKAFMAALSDPTKSKQAIDPTLKTLSQLFGTGDGAGIVAKTNDLAPPSSGMGNVDTSGAIVNDESGDGTWTDPVSGVTYRIGPDGQPYEE